MSWIVINEYRSLLEDYIANVCGEFLEMKFMFWEENTEGLPL